MPTDQQTYNGWTNYATWGVALVLDNDQGTYNEVRAMADDFLASSRADLPQHCTAHELATYRLEEWLSDYVEGMCQVPDSATQHGEGIFYPLMAQQVIQAGLSGVDWGEIAANVLSE